MRASNCGASAWERRGRRRRGLAAAVLCGCLLLSLRSTAAAGNATLTVTATVQSTIQIAFLNDPGASETTVGYCPISAAGTPNVGLDFSTCSRNTGCTRTCVKFTKITGGGNNQFSVESSLDLLVTNANSPSTTYHVEVSLQTLPPVEATYYVNNLVLGTGTQTLPASNPPYNYQRRQPQNVKIAIRNTLPAGLMTQTINYLATSN